MDDSLLRKTGRKIHGVRFLRDPLARPSKSIWSGDCACSKSPPPCPRRGRARMIPIDFQQAVLPAKPRKDAPEQEWQNY